MLIQYKGGKPHNTLAGLQKSLIFKINNLEIDICVSKDNKIIVCNEDDNFMKCKINQKTCNNLIYSAYPTLEQYLHFIGKEYQCSIFLNTKCGRNNITNENIDIITEYSNITFYLIVDSVEDFSYYSEICNCKIIVPADFYEEKYNTVYGVICNYCSIFEKDIKLFYDNGIKVYLYTINKFNLIKHYQNDSKIEGILSEKINDYNNFIKIDTKVLIEPHIQPILPKLWLGSENTSFSPKLLKKYNIKTIINATSDLFDSDIKGIRYIRLPIYNRKNYQKTNKKNCQYAAIIIHYYLKKEGNILVHCKNGHRRSALIILFYLMKIWKLDIIDIYDYLYQIRVGIFPPRTKLLTLNNAE